jgi:hypothetical protein
LKGIYFIIYSGRGILLPEKVISGLLCAYFAMSHILNIDKNDVALKLISWVNMFLIKCWLL